MKISKVSGRLVSLPPSSRWSDSTHQIENLEYLFAELATDEGMSGLGYAYTVGFGGSAVLELMEQLAPRLIGIDHEAAAGRLAELLDWLHPIGQGGVTSLALAAFDTAVWDLRAKAAGLPLHALWGTRRPDVLVYASGIDLHESASELERRVAGYLEAGYSAVKVKVGRDDPSEDLARLRAVRKLLGPSGLLMADANQRWSPGETISRSRLFEEVELYWLEEPVKADDIEGHARAKAGMRVPLATGETLFTARACQDLVERNATDILQADVCRVGGFSAWLKTSASAAGRTIPMAPHFAVELSIQVLCTIDNPLIAEYVYGGTLSDLGLLRSAIRPSRGRLAPPAAPGIGLELDADAAERATKRRFAIPE